LAKAKIEKIVNMSEVAEKKESIMAKGKRKLAMDAGMEPEQKKIHRCLRQQALEKSVPGDHVPLKERRSRRLGGNSIVVEEDE
jgi:hypothetical protein